MTRQITPGLHVMLSNYTSFQRENITLCHDATLGVMECHDMPWSVL